jgi:hypothetical protein
MKRKKKTEPTELALVEDRDDFRTEFISRFSEQHALKGHEKYALLRALGLPMEKAATICNFSKTYGYELDAKYRNKPIYKQKLTQIVEIMPEIYQQTCKLRLIQISQIEGQALNRMIEQPELAIKNPQLLKHIKVSSGVLKDDVINSYRTINIGQIQAYISEKMSETPRPIRTVNVQSEALLTDEPEE